MIILKNLDVLKLEEVKFDDYYFFDQNIHIRFYSNCVYLTMLENAMKRGKMVERYVVNISDISNMSDGMEVEFYKYLLNKNITLKDFIVNEMKNFEKREFKASKIFSPFFKPKRLKEEPKKWSIQWVVKAILTGQIKDIICDQYLTDDYSYDNANDFGKGKIDELELAKELTEEPLGWRIGEIKEDSGIKKISVNCYFFNYNSAEFDINANEREFKFEELSIDSNVIYLSEFKKVNI